jgi:hypothetical protein
MSTLKGVVPRAPSGPPHAVGPHGSGPHGPGFPHAPPPPPPPPGPAPYEVPGKTFKSFLKISAKRAFRLRIEPNEVLPSERAVLEHASPPVTDPNLQAFLAWRRSVLFLVAVALVPLTVFALIDVALLPDKIHPAILFVKAAPAAAEAVFLLICWSQLRRWANWRKQRRWLFWGWMLFLLIPFVVFVYPLRTVFEETARSLRTETMVALGFEGTYKRALAPFTFAMLAMLQLAPKAVSLMPGLIRSSLVIKLLFPGSSAPGWLIAMTAPLYALIAYTVLIVPYQFTGSGWFIAGVLGVVLGQAMLARAGFALARPLSEEEALVHIKRVRAWYMTVMVLSAGLIIVALATLVWKMNLQWTDVVTAVLKFEANVLMITLIGADLVVTNLDRARGYTAGRVHTEEATELKIAAFVGLDAPPAPPPPPPPR